MRVTTLGHAGLKVETSGVTLLIDPWFAPEGAFQASWFPYPDNSHLLTGGFFRPDAIVISHEHLDHFDPWFLAQVPSAVPIIVPRYPSPALRAKIGSAGPRPIIELKPWTRHEVAPGTTVYFVSEHSPMNHDSAIVVSGGGRTLLDLNDARLSPVQLREIRAQSDGIEMFCFQGAGASWYPIVYDYPAERKRQLSLSKRAAKINYAAAAMRIVQPVLGVPFAGPACFLDPELRRHNDEMAEGIFPDQRQVAEALAARGIGNTAVVLPGDTVDAEARVVEPDPTWSGFDYRDPRGYLEDYAERRRPRIEAVLARHPPPGSSLWPAFREHFERLLGLSPYFSRKIAMRVGFDLAGPGGGRWAVDFRPGSEGVFDTVGEPQVVYRLASRWMAPILSGEVPWEDFFLSLRFSAWRDPDVYNDHLLGLLKFAEAEAVEAVERYETAAESSEWLTIHAEDRAYRVERYCPHAGNDLMETAEVLPGRILRCLGHHYEFSLDTGACLNGNARALNVEPLGAGAPTGPRAVASRRLPR